MGARRHFTAIDLFCGAGGLSEGFRQAGFTILAANDFDRLAGETYQATHPETKFLPGPIENLTAADFLKAAGVKRGEIDCVIGGPPCQAFSVYNHQRGMHDERSGLFREYLRIVDGLKPKWIVLENVTGITSAGGGAAVKQIMKGLQDLGYTVDTRILKAEEFGIPQERRRMFFIGSRTGTPMSWPEPTHGLDCLIPFVTIEKAIGDLPPLKNGQDAGEPLPYAKPASSDYQRTLRGRRKLVHNHSAPKLAKINLERMRYIPQGGSWRDIPFELLPAGMKRARRCDHTKRYGRLSPDGLASTILTKCDLHWGSYIHPHQDRVLSVREAARLQSFPDHFIFQGPRTEQYVQVGNAVPPLLAKHIAARLHELLEAQTKKPATQGAKKRAATQPIQQALF